VSYAGHVARMEEKDIWGEEGINGKKILGPPFRVQEQN
jgi:hypothetical protein